MPPKALDIFDGRYESVIENWEDRRTRYLGYVRQVLAEDRKPKPWGAKVNSQHTHIQLLTHNAHTHAGLMPTYPWFHAQANEGFRDIEASATEEFNRRLKKMRFYTRMYLWRRLAGMYGVGFAKLARKPGRGVQFSLVNPADFAWDPEAEDIRFDATWVIERNERWTWAMVRELGRRGVFETAEVVKVKGTLGGTLTQRDEAREERFGRDHGKATGDDEAVELYHMVTPERLMTVHRPSNAVLQDRDNPYGYVNYYDLSIFPEVFEIEGYSIPEFMRDIQEEIDTTKRQRIDIVSLIANPIYKIKRSSNIDPFNLVARPGTNVLVNEQDDMAEMQRQNMTFGLAQEEQMLKQEADLVTGVMPNTRGQSGPAGMKATTANIIQSAVSTRFSVGLSLNADYPLQAVLDDFVKLSSLDDRPVAVTALEWRQIQEAVDIEALQLVSHIESFVGQGTTKAQMELQLLTAISQNLMPPGKALIIKDIMRQLQMRDVEKIEPYIIANPEVAAAGAAGQPNVPAPAQGRPGQTQTQGSARAMAAGQPPMAMGIPA